MASSFRRCVWLSARIAYAVTPVPGDETEGLYHQHASNAIHPVQIVQYQKSQEGHEQRLIEVPEWV